MSTKRVGDNGNGLFNVGDKVAHKGQTGHIRKCGPEFAEVEFWFVEKEPPLEIRTVPRSELLLVSSVRTYG